MSLALTGTGWAQALTGSLTGTVLDEQGAAVPRALVRISSPSLIAGSTSTDTNEKGRFRFWALPPGVYLLEIELDSFAPVREEEIVIGVGATLERRVVLKVSTLQQSVVVEGTGSRIDARASGVETRFGTDYLRTIPGRRFSMFDFVKAAPGVSPTSPTSGTNSGLSVFGSGTNENAFLLDGTNFTCPCSGNAIAEPGLETIEEVQVQSVGASAEFGNIQGAVVNVITRQGGDRLQGDASYSAQVGALTSHSVTLPCAGCGTATGYERDRYADITANLSGPVVRNHVWFFGGYQRVSDADSQPGTDPARPRTYEQNKVTWKLTWQVTPGLRLMHSFYDEVSVEPERPTFAKPFETTLRTTQSAPTSTFGNITYVMGRDTVLDARVGRIAIVQHSVPSTGSYLVANHNDRGIQSGGPADFGDLTRRRTTVKAILTHTRAGVFGADHEWRTGLQVERGEHVSFTAITTGTRFVDRDGRKFQSVSRDPFTAGGQFVGVSAFGTDTVAIGSRLTISAGLRFDRNTAISQDVIARDGEGGETNDIVRGAGRLYTWNVLSPRLGVTTKLRADGLTMLRASYGRFYQGILSGELDEFHPGLTPTTTMAFEATTGLYSRFVSKNDPKINVQLDPDIRSPFTDAFSIGLDQQVTRHVVISTAFVHKNGADYIGHVDIGGAYREETQTLPDGANIQVFSLANSTADRRFLMTNPGGYSMTYNGLVVSVEKRLSHRWQAFGSYTRSKAEGMQVSGSGGAAAAQVSSLVVPAAAQFGRDPNNLTNAGGRLPNDRPHILRAMGSVVVPGVDVMIAANVQHFIGKPWMAATQLTLPQGNTRVLLEERGARRLPSQTLLDVRVSRKIRCGGLGRIELLFDVLNALNESAEEDVATEDLYSPNFGRGTVFVDPRRAMLGVRMNLGR